MELSIIIVTYNCLEKTKVCLRSIFAHAVPDLNFEVIIVDNNSTENIDSLTRDFPQIKLIKNQANLGMGAGNNIGVKEASGKYLLILNPDTELKPNTLDLLLRYAKEHPEVGVIGPKIMYPDGERQISCYRFPDFFMPLYRRTFFGQINKSYLKNYLMQNFDLDQTTQADWLMGSCLLIPAEIFRAVGGFDERFFMYFEDTDLCRKIWAINKKIIYFPFAEIIHHHGRASAKSHWLVSIFKNKMARIHVISHLKYFLKWGI